jgi:hypothetical protein
MISASTLNYLQASGVTGVIRLHHPILPRPRVTVRPVLGNQRVFVAGLTYRAPPGSRVAPLHH